MIPSGSFVSPRRTSFLKRLREAACASSSLPCTSDFMGDSRITYPKHGTGERAERKGLASSLITTYLGERPVQHPPRCPSSRDYSTSSRIPSRTRLPHTGYPSLSPHCLAFHGSCKERRAVRQAEGVHGRHTYLGIYCRSYSRSSARRLLNRLDHIAPVSGPARSKGSGDQQSRTRDGMQGGGWNTHRLNPGLRNTELGFQKPN